MLAFPVSGRTREFGIRLAVGSEPRSIVAGVIPGAVDVRNRVAAGAPGGYALARIVNSFIQHVQLPGVVPIAISAAVLLAAGWLDRCFPPPAPMWRRFSGLSRASQRRRN